MKVPFSRRALVAIAFVFAGAGLGILSGCGSSTTWEEAQETDTYEAYQSYIEDNPEGEHVEDARKRADNRYWMTAKNDTTARAVENYLDEFPNGQFRSQAETRLKQLSQANRAVKGRVTGSNVIIRSDHTTESSSAGVVARKGTVVQILDQYSSGSSKEAILKRNITIVENGNRMNLSKGKAIRILTDRNDSVEASFVSPEFGPTQAVISKNDIEAMSGQKWYKIQTNDDITGWIYGKFIEEL